MSQGNRAGRKRTVREMSDDELAASFAHICEMQSACVTELSRRGLWKNFKQTHAEAKAAARDRERAEKAAEGGPQPLEHQDQDEEASA